jgi:hypothetical protein
MPLSDVPNDVATRARDNGAMTNFMEAVSINTDRIYDSCVDRDCIENLQVFFTTEGQPLIDAASSVRVKRAEVVAAYLDVEPVTFNRGFYSVEMTFYFKICINVYTTGTVNPAQVEGLCVSQKRVILYGSEGTVKTFSSDAPDVCYSGGVPTATVQAVDPLVLAFSLVGASGMPTEPIAAIPQCVRDMFDGSFDSVTPINTVLTTLGMFSIVQMERPVQIMVPSYDFVVPDRECNDSTDDPCELFRRLRFPTEEFFPPCGEADDT